MSLTRDESIAFAKKYLEDVLSFFGVNADVRVVSVHDSSLIDSNEVIELSIPMFELSGFLIGRGGETLRSLQSVTAGALRAQDAALNRVSIDIADYKKGRAERLSGDVVEWAQAVLASGEPMALKPMSASDRRTVHHVIDATDGLTTHSEGEGRDRHIVITKT